MNTLNLKLAQLDEKQLSQIQTLERELDCIIIAKQLYGNPIELSESNLKYLQDLEKELGVHLVAYQSKLTKDHMVLDENQIKKLNELKVELGNLIVSPQTKITPAEFSEPELEKIRALENELNLILIVYNKIYPQLKTAKLTNEQILKVNFLEKKVDAWVIALQPSLKLARLTEKQIKSVQELEKELQDDLLVFEPESRGNQ